MTRRIPPGLLALVVVLVGLIGVIGFELRVLGTQPAPPVPVASPGPAVPSSGGRSGIAPDDQTAQRVAIILARPLFSPDRRPIEAAGDADPTIARLTGVMITEDGNCAIFAGPSNGHPVVVGQGGRVGRYTVAAIDEHGVTIVGPDGRRVLHPSFDPSPVAVKVANRASAPATEKPPQNTR